MNWIKLITENLVAIATIIGLIITTIEFVVKCTKEKNWSALVKLVLTDMMDAETLFAKGSDKKQYCLERLESHAVTVGYPLTDDAIHKISVMIDDICDTSRIVNG